MPVMQQLLPISFPLVCFWTSLRETHHFATIHLVLTERSPGLCQPSVYSGAFHLVLTDLSKHTVSTIGNLCTS